MAGGTKHTFMPQIAWSRPWGAMISIPEALLRLRTGYPRRDEY
jgi:hypothetical protein